MIKSTIRKRTYRAIYRLLDRVSPVDYDCGTLCGAACCMVESEPDMEMGIYLLPGEDKIHRREGEGYRWTEESTEEFEFPESWKGKVFFLHCMNPLAAKERCGPFSAGPFRCYPI